MRLPSPILPSRARRVRFPGDQLSRPTGGRAKGHKFVKGALFSPYSLQSYLLSLSLSRLHPDAAL